MTKKFTHPIRKVVIPVAGLGTRFLPATKAIPKEMLPILDKPILQYVVEEAVASGITDIIFVTSYTKRACEDHFDRSPELEEILKSSPAKKDLYEKIKNISRLANFIYIRQKGPYGNGTPILNAKPIVGNEPFAMLWGDEVFDCPDKPRLLQLIEVFQKYGDPVTTGYQVPRADAAKYGMLKGVKVEPTVYQIEKIIEKPGPEKTPSLIANLGGYILTPDIFPILEKTKLGKGNELWLVDAVDALGKTRPIYSKIVDGIYYDTGNKLTWLKANIAYGLKDKEISKDLKAYLKKLI